MRYFLRRFIIISLIFGFLITALIIAGNNILNRKASFSIPDADTLVIFGHSHPECAYNDSLISNAKNLSSSGEAYFYTLPKIRKVLAQNPQIKTVFIEFSNNQAAKRMDEWIWGDNYMETQYPIYAPFIAPEDHRFLFAHNFKGYINSSCFALKKQLFSILTNNYAYTSTIGGYYYNKASKLDSMLAIQRKSSDTASYTAISDENLRYLKASIDFCLQNGKRVYLVRTPTHAAFPILKSEQVFQEVRSKYFSNVPFLDFAAFPVADAEYADLEHLNYSGARKFSVWIDKILKAGLLSLPDSEQQPFIRANMSM